jgi:preprotein translocase subunit SecA
MFKSLGKMLFGSVNDRAVKALSKIVDQVNAFEPAMLAMSDSELKTQTIKLKHKLSEGFSLDNILPEAFATVREASRRVLNMRHFDVQIMGGIVLHRGMIAEMRTGEGKTLVATLPIYLNALTEKGVHLVTVNDYLVKRDAEWMGQIYRFLGLTIGCITHDIRDEDRKAAYNCDITYGTNNEVGFDYLRDNMKHEAEQLTQRKFNFAIVDEVDSVLIDEARTPLVISGPTEDNSDLYHTIDKLITNLKSEDYEVDEKSRQITLTEDGMTNVEALLKKAKLIEEEGSFYDLHNMPLVHHVNQALRAHRLFTKDVDYMISNNQILIVDEFTGRALEGRRYSDGLHQALEAKEKLKVQNENQTLASITFQNYFRLYPKLAGMAGTAMTEATELYDIYKLEVIELPANKKVVRVDEEDVIYRTAAEKYNAIVEQIIECHKKEQPVLVGTVSIEKSEFISSILKKKKIPHHVLNAKYHDKEAMIIAQAGRAGAVTIATNMAGRGTDIKLGGNLESLMAELPQDLSEEAKSIEIKKIEAQIEEEKNRVDAAGGLFVIGTERHESRRIDNQLRGRSGRQGDPGRTQFYLSLEDDLMRIFASEKMGVILQKLGMQEGEAIFHPMISRALEKAQQKVEGRNYEIRKNLLKYDDVVSQQRKIIYEQRKEILETNDISDEIEPMYHPINSDITSKYIPANTYPEQWDIEGFKRETFRIYGIHAPIKEWAEHDKIDDEQILLYLNNEVEKLFAQKIENYSNEIFKEMTRRCLLATIDQLWKDHLYTLDHLRQSIVLRAYGQKDPLNEYKREAFHLFEAMMENIKEMFISRLAHLELHVVKDEEGNNVIVGSQTSRQSKSFESRVDPAEKNASNQTIFKEPARSYVPEEERNPQDPSTWGKIGRNELCPCGSGQKYKQCHGKI